MQEKLLEGPPRCLHLPHPPWLLLFEVELWGKLGFSGSGILGSAVRVQTLLALRPEDWSGAALGFARHWYTPPKLLPINGCVCEEAE